jgi:dihydroorotate dehydrogenase (NAD+) catalytic subunit
MAGARAVQVGTMTFAKPGAMLDIVDGLSDYCAKRSCKTCRRSSA